MKTCKKCGEAKPLDEFYAQKGTFDGRMGKCKCCVRAAVSLHRLLNIERVRAYDRERASLPHRAALRAAIVRRWRKQHPGRQAAHNKVNKSGLDKPDSCQSCGLKTRVEGHHENYSRPLDVMWLCKPCHVKADALRRAREANA